MHPLGTAVTDITLLWLKLKLHNPLSGKGVVEEKYHLLSKRTESP